MKAVWRSTSKKAYKPSERFKRWMIKTATVEAKRSSDWGFVASGNGLVLVVVVTTGELEIYDCTIKRIKSGPALYEGPPYPKKSKS